MATSNTNIVIIGAGLAGLGMALALHSHGIACAIYEQAPATGRFAGAINLSPNSLRILDQYGLYDRLLSSGCSFSYIDWQNSEGKSVERQYLGSKELFDYDALRIYRNIVVKEIQGAVQERGISIHYDKKFSRVVEETDESVTVEFQDGSHVTGDFVIAADGIHSKIRAHLYPDIQAKYTGMLVVAGSVKRSNLALAAEKSLTTPITQLSPSGGFILATQKPDGSELLAGTTKKFPEQDRAGWDRIAHDFAFQQSFLEEGLEERSELMKSAITHVSDDSRYIWPQRILPRLPSWTSDSGRILIIGDAAHAIPPVTGQGANQAFEDGYTLALVLAKKPINVTLTDALGFWQTVRQERLDKLRDFTQKVSNMWLPPQAKAQLKDEDVWKFGEGAEALRWLYVPDLDKVFGNWNAQHSD